MASAGIYLRQSLDRNDDEAAIDRQKPDCQKLCALREWNVHDIYVDNDTPATIKRGRKHKPRPEFERLMADAEAGIIAAIVVWDADRLVREPIEAERIIAICEDRAIPLASVYGEYDLSTDNGRLFFRVKVAFAKAEMERKSARQKAQIQQLAADGRPHVGGQRPFGYTKTREIIESEATLVRQAFDHVLAGGTIYGLSNTWNAAGHRTAKGNKWCAQVLRRMLTNSAYIAKRTHNGEIITTGKWKPIVEVDVFESVQQFLESRTKPPVARRHLLTGLAVCGACGSFVKPGWKDRKKGPRGGQKGTGEYVFAYRCATPGCLKVSRLGAPIDKWITDNVVLKLSQPEGEKVFQTKRNGVDLGALRQQGDLLRRRRDIHLAELRNDPNSSYAEYREARKDFDDQIAAIQNQLDAINVDRKFDGLEGARAEGRVAEWFDALDLGRKRAVIRTMMTPVIKPLGNVGRARVDVWKSVDPGWNEGMA